MEPICLDKLDHCGFSKGKLLYWTWQFCKDFVRYKHDLYFVAYNVDDLQETSITNDNSSLHMMYMYLQWVTMAINLLLNEYN